MSPSPDVILDGSPGAFVHSPGRDLLSRTDGVLAWREARVRAGVWAAGRSLATPLGPRITLRTEAGIAMHGLNFATQDPLSLSAHPALHEAARDALGRYGLHAPGSPCFAGTTAATLQLETLLARFLGLEHIVLFPSGWAAAFGVLTALLHADDHVLVDERAHPALQAGAAAATPRVTRYAHLDVADVTARLRAVRAVDAGGAILVVTETLFPYEADSPDLRALDDACRAQGASLLVAVGYDLGVSGPAGAGVLGIQGMLGQVDFVVGSFAKSFATNGGFFATRAASVKQIVRFAASPHAASNALTPMQAAIAHESLRIVSTTEGDQLRANLAQAVGALREACSARALHCLGTTAALVPIAVGAERDARLAEALAAERGVLCTVVEEPFVPRHMARLGLHVMAAHRPEHAIEAAEKIATALAAARSAATGAAEPGVPLH